MSDALLTNLTPSTPKQAARKIDTKKEQGFQTCL
jgi:hypothetical protein